MKSKKIIKFVSVAFILLSAISFLSVSLMAFSNPQSVMDLVNIKLDNTDAYSSIRGVYGGVGLTIFISLIYLSIKSPQLGLAFLSILWGFYAVSRVITIFIEGDLGAFGSQWLTIESVFCLVAITLFVLTQKLNQAKSSLHHA